MYSTCLFCAHQFGANESIEHFPVGRRLAFDAAKGRLWVVCGECERWNLTPLEERWEAVEECERAYRATRLRVATDNIGLARLADGTELVRIGRPLRPELAAWRYGDQFGRRRRRALIGSITTGAGVAAAAIAAPFLGATLATMGTVAGVAGYAAALAALSGANHFSLTRNPWLADDDGSYLWLAPSDFPFVRLVAAPEDRGGWGVHVPFQERRPGPDWKPVDLLKLPGGASTVLTGPAAVAAIRKILPVYNGRGASRQVVRSAVETLVALGGDDPSRAFRGAADRVREYGARQTFGDTGALPQLPREVRLALEMAANEDMERRAMEGELALLERAWKDAEEVAAIADDLLLPAGVPGMLATLRRRVRPPRAR